MKRIHFVSPYKSVAMLRMLTPLTMNMSSLYVTTEGAAPDNDADLNYHLPYHTLSDWPVAGGSKHVMVHTHMNPPDVERLMTAAEKADAVVCMSFVGRQELIRLGVDPRKLHVIYSATGAFQYRRRVLGVVGYVQPNGRKREHILLDLAWQYDLSMYEFALVGTGWEQTANALRALGVAVTEIQYPDDNTLVNVYNHLDALIVTGHAEGGPLPALEAMAAGVPVISPRFGYPADLMADDDRFYQTAEELHEQLERLFEKSIEGHILARSWTWTDYAAEHALLFGRLLDDSVDLFPERGMSRYAQLLDVIDEIKPRMIVEIGTWNGHRALQMIQQAARYKPIEDVCYQGFDLFDEQTGEHLRSELSKVSWPMNVVRRRLEATEAEIELVCGDTRKTLRNAVVAADLYFIDGGHSEDTIRNDWFFVMTRASQSSVIVFDDYYHTGKPEGMGCNETVDALAQNANWEVIHLPVRTLTEDDLEIGMVKVRRNANLRLQMQTWTYPGGYSFGGLPPANSMPDMRRDDVQSPASSAD